MIAAFDDHNICPTNNVAGTYFTYFQCKDGTSDNYHDDGSDYEHEVKDGQGHKKDASNTGGQQNDNETVSEDFGASMNLELDAFVDAELGLSGGEEQADDEYDKSVATANVEIDNPNRNPETNPAVKSKKNIKGPFAISYSWRSAVVHDAFYSDKAIT